MEDSTNFPIENAMYPRRKQTHLLRLFVFPEPFHVMTVMSPNLYFYKCEILTLKFSTFIPYVMEMIPLVFFKYVLFP